MRAHYKRVNKIKESAKKTKRAYKISKGCFLQFVIIAEANLCIIQDIYANSFKIARVCVCAYSHLTQNMHKTMCAKTNSHIPLKSEMLFPPSRRTRSFLFTVADKIGKDCRRLNLKSTLKSSMRYCKIFKSGLKQCYCVS